MRKTARLLLILVTTTWLPSCTPLHLPAPAADSCPEWVTWREGSRPGEVLDRRRQEEDAVQNRNMRCHCYGELDYCAK